MFRTSVVVAGLWSVLVLAGGCGDDTTHNDPDSGCVPADEICNGRDDDCDGQIDEFLDVDLDGDGHLALESCSKPADDCNDGDSQIHPGHPEHPYYCDGKDNDCDGQTDEDCACDPGPPPEEKECSTDEGECVKGMMICHGSGSWGECDGIGPEVESCDLRDNDCDGVTDNVQTPPACELTEGVCADAVRTQCEPCEYGLDYEEVEASCDELDNDCDGMTNEGLPGDQHEDNDTCHIPAELSSIYEDDTDQFVEGTLFRTIPVPEEDLDWYRFTFVEDTHAVDCALNGPDQCFQAELRLEVPQAADHTQWELCALNGITGTCDDVGNPQKFYCTQSYTWDPVLNSYHLSFKFAGTCGVDDGGYLFFVVRGKDALVVECDSYKVWMRVEYFGTTACPSIP